MAGTYHNSFQTGALGLASGAASTRTDIEIWQHPRIPLLATVFRCRTWVASQPTWNRNRQTSPIKFWL